MVSQPVVSPTPPKRLRFVDYLGIFFGITTVVGFVLAYYWHAQSIQERAPTYFVSPARARIIDTSVPAPPQLQILYKGKDLNGNVNAVIVYFWNDGKLPIKSEDVLEPVRIQLEPGSEIIDARILKASRPVTNVVKGEVRETAKNELPLSFRILEHNDGAALQIIYRGAPEAQVSVSGTIIGSSQPRQTAPYQNLWIKAMQGSRHDRYTAIGAILIAVVISAPICFGLILVMDRLDARLHQRPTASDFLGLPERKTILIGVGGMLLGMFAGMTALILSPHPRSEPIPASIQIQQP